MSKLISKIEEKLGGSSSSNEGPNKLQKDPHEDKSNSSSGIGNTSNWANRTTGTDSGAPDSIRHPISNTSGPTGTAVTNDYSSATPNVTSRDGTQGRMTGPGGYTSSGTSDRVEPRQPYDPYSAKGQQTAADAAAYNTSGTPYASTQSQGLERAPGNTAPRGTTEGSLLGRREEPQHATASDNHYGRDAGVIGGAGAAGLGTYEVAQHHGSSDVSHSNRDNISGSGGQPLRSTGVGGAGAAGTNTLRTGGTSGEASAENKAKAMGEAYQAGYQAGYKDAVEHMKHEAQSGSRVTH